MKEIKAYIKPNKVSAVALALHRIGSLSGLTVWEVRGFSGDRIQRENPPVGPDWIDYAPYVRIEVLCPDDVEYEAVASIERAAYTGLPGDGKIFVTDISRAIRIETGERGDAALMGEQTPVGLEPIAQGSALSDLCASLKP